MRGNRKRYTLNTGASMGLGKSLAQECAKRGHKALFYLYAKMACCFGGPGWNCHLSRFQPSPSYKGVAPRQ